MSTQNIDYKKAMTYKLIARDVYANFNNGDNRHLHNGHEYRIERVVQDKKTGYFGAIYWDMKTNELIVAHRGTELSLSSLNDLWTDATMAARNTNNQYPASKKN